ncbi:hypothetical protein [Aurantibacter aestuarii]|uniref:Uncharacterized protein n=1 Tax=Aurantibacter aestuarii TaxID=1266046 RepID=A0A2T1NEJ2_9FLAO|nr:hypothetical protein [Aurantibacter aestuarii]PSG90872.1 hypothetical protein C7H52_06255 [Aurantibacter aestuarii]
MTFKESLIANWKEIVIVLITAGALGQFIGVWDLTVKREDNYIDKYVGCKDAETEIRAKLSEVENRLNTIELASSDIPFPFWIKDLNSTVLFVNKEFKTKILNPLKINPITFIGTRGEALGDEKFIQMILDNDFEVIKARKKIIFDEYIEDFGWGKSYKYPLFGNSGYVIGTAGIWIPNEPIFD